MAKLFITEYSLAGFQKSQGITQIAHEPAVTTQTVAISGSAAASSAFNANTAFVRIHTDSICSIAFGTAPTATANSPRMAADSTEYFEVPQGQSFKVSVISNT